VARQFVRTAPGRLQRPEFPVRDAHARLMRPDPWADFDNARRPLTRAMQRRVGVAIQIANRTGVVAECNPCFALRVREREHQDPDGTTSPVRP